MRPLIGLCCLLAACTPGEPANEAATAPKEQSAAPSGAAPRGDPAAVAAAEQSVREHLGAGGDVRFGEARSYLPNGNVVVCGTYERDGASQRYVYLAAGMTILEPRWTAMGMNMDDAAADYCRE